MTCPLLIRLVWDIGVRIYGNDVTLKSGIFTTAVKQSPYVPGYNIRLVMPRVRYFFDGTKICVSKNGFGPGWQKIARPGGAGVILCPKYQVDITKNVDNQLKHMVPIPEMVERANELHADPNVRDELEEQTELFVEKSSFFAEYGICPPVKRVFEVVPVMEDAYWPNRFSGSMAGNGQFIWEFNIQMTRTYMETHHSFFAVELEDVWSLPHGSWRDDGTNPEIHTYKHMDHHPTNIINGYYIDWELYGWHKRIVSDECNVLY